MKKFILVILIITNSVFVIDIEAQQWLISQPYWAYASANMSNISLSCDNNTGTTSVFADYYQSEYWIAYDLGNNNYLINGFKMRVSVGGDYWSSCPWITSQNVALQYSNNSTGPWTTIMDPSIGFCWPNYIWVEKLIWKYELSLLASNVTHLWLFW